MEYVIELLKMELKYVHLTIDMSHSELDLGVTRRAIEKKDKLAEAISILEKAGNKNET